MQSPRAEGDPISIERVITEEWLTYQPPSDTVRYPTLMNSEGPVAYGTDTFERWADRRCASIGSEAVLPAIQDRFEKEVTGIGKEVTSEQLDSVITVSTSTTRDRDGNIVTEPNISFQALVERAPRTVRTTVTLEDRDHTRSVPVFVERQEFVYL